MNARSPFHSGEVAMQRRAGVSERMQEIGGRVIREWMPDQHREFFRTLPALVVGSIDANRRPWASMLVGAPGFVSDPSATQLLVDALPDAGDVLSANLKLGGPVGMLGIEPATRRRNRVNGRVAALNDRGFELDVDQSFGNCPQYIQARSPQWVDQVPQPLRRLGSLLDAGATALIEQADTFFIASASPQASSAEEGPGEGVDVSHRGGKPGFVRVEQIEGASVLTFPEFRGNFFFNTLGNLLAHPYAGLLFVDHASGDVLQLTGRAEVIEEGAQVRSFKGAQRLVRIRVDEAVFRPHALPLRWSPPDPAPQLVATGDWGH